eukprot:jgi/Orpsp1_1/1189025/evm.model.d7180000068919.1
MNGSKEISEDCKKYNQFMKSDKCCIDAITKDSVCLSNLDGTITGISIINEIDNDFNEFPIFDGLKELRISNMKANVLPKQFFQLPNLITLNIENSNISEIPSDINTDSPIQEIIINNCKLKEFPHFLTKLQYLKELQLNNNEMTGILNKQFKEFPKIENM